MHDRCAYQTFCKVYTCTVYSIEYEYMNMYILHHVYFEFAFLGCGARDPGRLVAIDHVERAELFTSPRDRAIA